MLKRKAEKALRQLSDWYPAVVVTGPRQSGKTTLVRAVFKNKPYVSLEDPDIREFAEEDPRGFLAQYTGGAILDEVQRVEKLFSYLQTVLDKSRSNGLFILTGSQQFLMNEKISQSLAGRSGYLELLPFSSIELAENSLLKSELSQMLLNGFYPPVYDRSIPPEIWYADYIRTYLERDVRLLMNIKDLTVFQTFLKMCAARTGQLLNLSSLAADCGISHNTAKSYISILESSYIIKLIPAYSPNLRKRLIRAPKLHFLDSGLAAWLAGQRDMQSVSLGNLRGPLFESWVISELLKFQKNRLLSHGIFHYRDSHHNEIDIVIEKGHQLISAIEIKSGQTLASEWVKALNKFSEVMKHSNYRIDKTYLVYGGEPSEPFTYKGSHVYGRSDIEKMFSDLFI